METECNYEKQNKKIKLKPNVIHKRLSERLKTLSHTGMQKFYHYLVPGFNMSIEDIELEDFNVTQNIQCSIPKSIYVSSNDIDSIDLCHQRVAIHHGFMYKIKYNSSVFDNYLREKKFRKAMSNGTYPTAVIRALNLIKANPHPYFSGDYDWYFTGGNLAHSKDFLLRATGKNMDTLNVSTIKTKRLKSIFNVEFNEDEENKPTSEILEIQASKNLKNRFIVRYEKNIIKYCYDGSELTCLYNITKSSVPFITFSDHPFNENLILTGDLNRQIHLWDVNNSTKTPTFTLLAQKNEISERSDNWNSLHHFNNHSFTFADFEKFALIDGRVEAFVDEINFTLFDGEISACEKIASLVVSSKYKNLIYIGTTHKLLGIDARYLKKKSKQLILLQWTHQMEYPPLILKTHISEDFELVVASSPLSREIRLFEVRKTQDINLVDTYLSPNLPITPPDLLNSLNLAKLQGECLSPLVDLESRIKKCTTGLDLVLKNNKLQLLVANSIGDIFSSKITFNEEVEYTKKYHTDIIKNYYDTVEDKYRRSPKELHATDLKDMSKISKILRCNKLSSKNDLQLHQNKNSNELENNASNDNEFLINDFSTINRKKYKWEKLPAQYAQCKDILASNLLSVWDFDLNQTNPDEYHIEQLSTTHVKEKLYQSRVQSWVEDIQQKYKNNQFVANETEDETDLNSDKSLNEPNNESEFQINQSQDIFETMLSNTPQINSEKEKLNLSNENFNYSISNSQNNHKQKLSQFNSFAHTTLEVSKTYDDTMSFSNPTQTKKIKTSNVNKDKKKYVQGF